jgi:hypothetical protein
MLEGIIKGEWEDRINQGKKLDIFLALAKLIHGLTGQVEDYVIGRILQNTGTNR